MIRKHIKHDLLMLSAVLVMALTGCAPEVNTHTEIAKEEPAAKKDNDKASGLKNNKKLSKKKSAKKKNVTDDNDLSEDIYREDAGEIFAEMSDWEFSFSSGAGGWSTELYVKPDGSFSGIYQDGEMGSTGPGYENGTIYRCDFSGRFSDYVRAAGPGMHSLFIESIEYENEPDTEEIIDNILYKYTTPYGLEGAADTDPDKDDAPLVFMEAGAVTSAINSEEMSWIAPIHFGTYLGSDWDYVDDTPEELPFAVLINTVEDYAFCCENISERNRMYLVNKVKLPGLTNVDLTVEDDGTYYCVDENDDKSFRVINTCFEAKRSYDPYSNAAEFINDSLREIYGRSAPGYDEISVISPKDASEYNYPQMAVNGTRSDYAFWNQSGDKSRTGEGRFVYLPSYGSGSSHVYAYIIESNRNITSYPDSGFAGFYNTSLTFTGKSDGISSAGEGDGAVRSILAEMMTPIDNAVLATEVIMVSDIDTDLIKKYHLEGADFDDDYELVSPDNRLHEYKLAGKGETPFYVQYPADRFHRLYPAYSLEEYMGENSNDNTRLMKLYLNEDDEVVYAYEMYTP